MSWPAAIFGSVVAISLASVIRRAIPKRWRDDGTYWFCTVKSGACVDSPTHHVHHHSEEVAA